MSKERDASYIPLIENLFLPASAVVQLPEIVQDQLAKNIGLQLWERRDEVDVFVEAAQYFELTMLQFTPDENISPEAALDMKGASFICFLSAIDVYMQYAARDGGEEVIGWEKQLIERLCIPEELPQLVSSTEATVHQELTRAKYFLHIWIHILEAIRRESETPQFVTNTAHAIMAKLFQFTLHILQGIKSLKQRNKDRKYETSIEELEELSKVQLGRFIPSFGKGWGVSVKDNPQELRTLHDLILHINSTDLTLIQTAVALQIVETGLKVGKSELSIWQLFSISNPQLSQAQVVENKQWWIRKLDMRKAFRESTLAVALDKSNFTKKDKYVLYAYLAES